MRSMTGFGQASGENRNHAVTVILKGVNHRYLEIKLRLEDEYRSSEPALRDLLQKELFRGRVDVTVEVRRLTERDAEVEVHRGVVRAAHATFHELVEEGLLTRELTAGDLIRLPEAVTVRVAPDRWDEQDHRLLTEVARQALDEMVRARTSEGERLAVFLVGHVEGLETRVGRLELQREGALEEIAAGLEERLERLLAQRAPERTGELDRSRLTQEVAILADKSDVREELDRLTSHLEHFREILDHSDRPVSVGKRLDFLCQEIFRELNTLGAKCRNSEMTRVVLDAKGVAEQLREQVQNVE
jgi:uncharacterized protein (TIGR00255 family)